MIIFAELLFIIWFQVFANVIFLDLIKTFTVIIIFRVNPSKLELELV